VNTKVPVKYDLVFHVELSQTFLLPKKAVSLPARVDPTRCNFLKPTTD
jgi:hypothetical protein